MNFNENVSPWKRVEVNSEQNLIKLNVMRNLEILFDLHYPSPSCQPTAHSTCSFSASHIYFHKNFPHSTFNSFLRKWKFQSAHKSQLIYITTHPAYLLIMWIYIYFSLIFLSSSPLARLIFVQQENIGLVVPWMLGVLTFMSLEAVATVYQNILRDHINGVSFVYLKFQILSPFSLPFFAPAVSRYPVCVCTHRWEPFKSLFNRKFHSLLLSFKHFDGLCKAEAVSARARKLSSKHTQTQRGETNPSLKSLFLANLYQFPLFLPLFPLFSVFWSFSALLCWPCHSERNEVFFPHFQISSLFQQKKNSFLILPNSLPPYLFICRPSLCMLWCDSTIWSVRVFHSKSTRPLLSFDRTRTMIPSDHRRQFRCARTTTMITVAAQRTSKII